ncbi:helix-turn-helix domain-containing protein [Nocardia sp. NPDC050435]|uniref:helix-turn-helix domain-containing protein n=1 Tax=Nocardia sp. NPDC050435 TaxID=3155040 RepID=UPI0033D0B1CF
MHSAAATSLPHATRQPTAPRPQLAPAVRERPGQDGLSWVLDRPEIGIYLRRRREALGISQEALALAAATTVSSLRKWEAGLRNPSIEGLIAWCRALDLPDWTVRKVISIVFDGIDTLQAGSWPPAISEDDRDHLDDFRSPAYYLSFPQLDVLAANRAALRWVPSLAPAQISAPRPSNIVEWIMSADARTRIGNWETVATRLVYLLRVMGPGIVPQHRMDEIFNTAYALAPKHFTRIFCASPSKTVMNDDLVLLRDPLTNQHVQYTYRLSRPNQPLRPHEQLNLVRRSNPVGLLA